MSDSHQASSQWTEADCKDLQDQLQSLGYRHPFDPSSAPLIAVLFRDVVKGARYGKTAQKLLDERNGTIASLENELNKAKSNNNAELGPPLHNLKCRFFRLLRLASSAIYIASKTVESPAKETTKWTSASTGLLAALLSYEKQLNLERDIPKAEGTDLPDKNHDAIKYPSFLVEFHELWKTIEERDLAREEVREREDQLTQILAGNKETALMPLHHKNELEEELLLHVQTLKTRLENIVEGLPSGGGDLAAGALLKQLDAVKQEASSLKQANKSIESELRYVEKKFASHLKECQKQTLGDLNRVSNDENNKRELENKSCQEGETQWREERRRLQIVLDSKNMDLSILQTQVAKMSTEVHEANKNWFSASNAHRTASEELSAVQKRCDLFENEFRNLDMKRIEDEEHIKRLDMDLEELKEVKKRYEEATNRLEDVQIRYVALDQQLAATKEELQCKALQYECLLKAKTALEGENERRKVDVEDGAFTINKLNQKCRESRSELHKVKLELVRLKEDLGNESKAIENEADRNRKLKQQVDELQEAEVNILREKEEALKGREMYRASLKDARRRIEALEGEIEELKTRNDFILSQLLYNNNDVDGGCRGMAPSPSIPQTILNALASQTTGDETHELDNRNLRIENALMREKYESLISMLRKTTEARKQAQTEVNRLTILVTTLESKLMDANDHFELGNFKMNKVSDQNSYDRGTMGGDKESCSSRFVTGRQSSDLMRSETDTSRFGSNKQVIQSASTNPNTIQSASDYPENSTSVILKRFDRDRTPSYQKEYSIRTEEGFQERSKIDRDSISLGDPFTTRPMHQFRANTQPVSFIPKAFNCNSLRAHLSPPEAISMERFSNDPTPVPTNKDYPQIARFNEMNVQADTQNVTNVSSEGDADSASVGRESHTLPSNDETSYLFQNSCYRDRPNSEFGTGPTEKGLLSISKTSFRERALSRLKSQRETVSRDESLLLNNVSRLDVISSPAVMVVNEEDYQIEVDSPAVSLSGTSSLSSSRYSEYISRHGQMGGLPLSSPEGSKDASVFSYTNEANTPGTNDDLGEPLSGPRGYCVDHLQDSDETPKCHHNRNFDTMNEFDEDGEDYESLPTSFGLLNLSKALKGPILSNRTIGGSFGLSRSSEASSLWMISQTSTAKITSGATSFEYSESEATTNPRNKY